MTECEHIWGPWERVFEVDADFNRTETGDRVHMCLVCGKWEAEWGQ